MKRMNAVLRPGDRAAPAAVVGVPDVERERPVRDMPEAPPRVESSGPGGLLERRFDAGWVDRELLLYGLLFVASLLLHFWQLGRMAMAHDESIHAWMSWRFFTGRGSFECAGGRTSATYCYDPVYHGPTLYFATLIGYFLFGPSDVTARLPQTLAGLALVPGCYLLRPLLGKRTALVAAVLVTLSPSMLYFSRYARHDALILLWALLLTAGLFRWLRDGGTANLVLAAVSLALAWATHELVFILIFIGTTFLFFRILWEWRPRWFLIFAGAALGLAVLVASATFYFRANEGVYTQLHRLLGPILLGGTGALMALIVSRSWPLAPVVTERLRATWTTRADAYGDQKPGIWGLLPPALWWSLGAFLVVFGLLFSTFLAYPRGFLDGWYQGIRYWWGSQHEFARGGQPWFYYLMLLPIYELLSVVFALAGIAILARGPRRAAAALAAARDGAGDAASENGSEHIARTYPAPASSAAIVDTGRSSLFVAFLGYWSVLSLLAFSWAGEKMPWLLIHTALPVTLLAAWVLAGLISRVRWREVWAQGGWSVPLLVVVTVVLGGVAAYYLSGAGATQAAMSERLRAFPALGLFALTLFTLFTVAARIGGRNTGRLAALTGAAVLLLYGVRSAVQVVYLHPDTPIEPLIYTQTAPDVPAIVREIDQVSINRSRNERSKDDPTGGLSMPVVIDRDLAWPFQWYLRDYRSVSWINPKTDGFSDTSTPVVVLHTPNITEEIRDTLAEEHVRTSQGVFNWWFPEYDAPADASQTGEKPARGYKDIGKQGPWAVLSWPFRPSNWPSLARFMLYREVRHKLDGRELEVFIRRDAAPVVGGGAAPVGRVNEPMTVNATVGAGQLNGPRGIAMDASGNLYVADSFNHRVAVFDPSGALLRSIGAKGSDDGQLNEPSGVAVDADGNVYVADTWNARVAKFGPDGAWIKSWGSGREDFGDGRRATDTKGEAQANADNPLGFYGPRNVLVVGERVYIADTGNKRIVVTDREGNFVEQWGTLGAEPGQFHEPIGLGVDQTGKLYIGDTWNGRVQVFEPDPAGPIKTQPVQVISISGWEKDTYNDPYLAVTPDGRTLVALAGRNAVGVYNAEGKLERRLRGTTEQLKGPPKGLAVAPDGSALVVDGGGNQVLRFPLP